MSEERSVDNEELINNDEMASHANLNKLSASEALFCFVGGLTCREEPITLGSNNDCSEIARLIQEFIDKQHLDEPEENWADKIIR